MIEIFEISSRIAKQIKRDEQCPSIKKRLLKAALSDSWLPKRELLNTLMPADANEFAQTVWCATFERGSSTLLGRCAELYVSALTSEAQKRGLLQVDEFRKISGSRDYYVRAGNREYLWELTQTRYTKNYSSKQFSDLDGRIPRSHRRTLLIADEPEYKSRDGRDFGRNIGSELLFGVPGVFDCWFAVDPEIHQLVRGYKDQYRPRIMQKLFDEGVKRGLPA